MREGREEDSVIDLRQPQFLNPYRRKMGSISLLFQSGRAEMVMTFLIN